jgi:hypothetical protein
MLPPLQQSVNMLAILEVIVLEWQVDDQADIQLERLVTEWDLRSSVRHAARGYGAGDDIPQQASRQPQDDDDQQPSVPLNNSLSGSSEDTHVLLPRWSRWDKRWTQQWTSRLSMQHFR